MRHVILTRSAYGPGWTIEANRRRLAMTEGVTVASLRSQTSQSWRWIVLLHRQDPLLAEREWTYGRLGATFIYADVDETPSRVAFEAYRAPWSEAIGDRNEVIAMTRLDDDDGFAPWAMERVETVAARTGKRTVLMFPMGVRVWAGRYTMVSHKSNAMQTLVTAPGDRATVYDYGHRNARRFAPVHVIDARPAWLWSRHPDTISGWRIADQPLTPEIRALFRVDWSLFGQAEGPIRVARTGAIFR